MSYSINSFLDDDELFSMFAIDSNPQLQRSRLFRLNISNGLVKLLGIYIEAHPQDPDGYYYRGLYYDRVEHYHLGLADFDRAISLLQPLSQNWERGARSPGEGGAIGSNRAQGTSACVSPSRAKGFR